MLKFMGPCFFHTFTTLLTIKMYCIIIARPVDRAVIIWTIVWDVLVFRSSRITIGVVCYIGRILTRIGVLSASGQVAGPHLGALGHHGGCAMLLDVGTVEKFGFTLVDSRSSYLGMVICVTIATFLETFVHIFSRAPASSAHFVGMW